MANEIVIHYLTGETVYAHLFNSIGQVWNGAAFEAPQDANWVDYALAMTEAGTTGYYRGSMPAVDAGAYSFVVFVEEAIFILFGGAGGGTIDDVSIGQSSIQWDGSAEIPLSDLATAVALATAQADLDDPTQYMADVTGMSTLTAAEVWSYVTRTLTQSAAQIQDIVEGSVVSVYQYTTWSFSLTGLGDISARDRLYFTAKGNLDDDDDESATILQVEETDGLLYIGGAAPTLATLGTLVVNDGTLGNITVTVDDSVTGLENQHGAYDVKMVTAAGTTSVLTISTFQIKSVVTKAVE